MTSHAIIIGGGIAGLATAALLGRAGVSCLVLEQSPVLKEVGAGLQISPNGGAVLRALGIEQKLLAQGSPRAGAVSLRDERGAAEVARLDLQRLAPAQTYCFVHRADLLEALKDAALAANVCLRTGCRVREVSFANGPEIHLENAEVLKAGFVVGADGLHSIARKALNPQSTAFFTKQVAWRASVANTIKQPAEARVYMGAGKHIVTYPLRGGKWLNVVAVHEQDAWAEEGWHHQGDPAALRQIFASFQGDARETLVAVDEVATWGLFRHPVAQCWAHNGLALVGDAAHPMLPFLAQGANMALEDAWVVTQALLKGDLDAYQKQRERRVRKVVKTTQGNAKRYHLPPGFKRYATHKGLNWISTMAPSLMLKPFNWLYDHDVTKEPL